MNLVHQHGLTSIPQHLPDGLRQRSNPALALNGVENDVDCAFLLHGTLGEPLRDPEYFRQVRVDDEARTVVSPNGLDPAPEPSAWRLRAGNL